MEVSAGVGAAAAEGVATQAQYNAPVSSGVPLLYPPQKAACVPVQSPVKSCRAAGGERELVANQESPVS